MSRYANVDWSRVVRRRAGEPGAWRSWLAGALTVVFLLWVGLSLVRSGILEPGIVFKFLTAKTILEGAWHTLLLATVSQIVGMVIGIAAAVLRANGSTVTRAGVVIYAWLFRGTPLLVQLLFWFNAIPAAFPRIVIGVPFTDTVVLNMPTTTVMAPFFAALIGLALNEGAYMSEIVRSGMAAVAGGQRDAARAIGMTHAQITRRIVLPQALRIVIPAAGNQYILMLKSTSLAYVITYAELVRAATDIYSTNFRVMELLVVASFWYLVMTSIASLAQSALERRTGTAHVP
ncbi:MAG: amino acid ABC transporter permease [Alphaproteobacteria bacterium]